MFWWSPPPLWAVWLGCPSAAFVVWPASPCVYFSPVLNVSFFFFFLLRELPSGCVPEPHHPPPSPSSSDLCNKEKKKQRRACVDAPLQVPVSPTPGPKRASRVSEHPWRLRRRTGHPPRGRLVHTPRNSPRDATHGNASAQGGVWSLGTAAPRAARPAPCPPNKIL